MKYLLPIFGLLLFLSFVPTVLAHVGGKSLLTINGVSTLPVANNKEGIQDIPAGNYLPNQSLVFQMDTTIIPVPPLILEKTVFVWDFGDGTPIDRVVNGTQNQHAYKKPGKYILKISADYKSAGFESIKESQLLDTVQITVVSESSNWWFWFWLSLIIGGGMILGWIIFKRKARHRSS